MTSQESVVIVCGSDDGQKAIKIVTTRALAQKCETLACCLEDVIPQDSQDSPAGEMTEIPLVHISNTVMASVLAFAASEGGADASDRRGCCAARVQPVLQTADEAIRSWAEHVTAMILAANYLDYPALLAALGRVLSESILQYAGAASDEVVVAWFVGSVPWVEAVLAQASLPAGIARCLQELREHEPALIELIHDGCRQTLHFPYTGPGKSSRSSSTFWDGE